MLAEDIYNEWTRNDRRLSGRVKVTKKQHMKVKLDIPVLKAPATDCSITERGQIVACGNMASSILITVILLRSVGPYWQDWRMGTIKCRVHRIRPRETGVHFCEEQMTESWPL